MLPYIAGNVYYLFSMHSPVFYIFLPPFSKKCNIQQLFVPLEKQESSDPPLRQITASQLYPVFSCMLFHPSEYFHNQLPGALDRGDMHALTERMNFRQVRAK